MYVCPRVLVSFGRDKGECGASALKGELFHGGADTADKKVIGCSADKGANDGHQPAYGGLAQTEEELSRDIFEQAAGGDEAGFESDGYRDHGHKFFKTERIDSAPGVNDGQCHPELLGDVIEEIEG